MNAELIMVRYGELVTKGKNKINFINALKNNLKRMLKNFSALTFEVKQDHIYIHLNGEDYEKIRPILASVSGLSSFSPVYKTSKDINEIKKISLKLLLDENKQTFKIKAKRADKSYPIISDDINRQTASYILANSAYKVDVHNPDIIVSITIREQCTYVFTSSEIGIGGYPLGIQGKAMVLLSGGIDSPVASYLMIRRGIMVECIHFASPPYTSEAVITKIKDILKKLSFYQGEIKLHVIPFTNLQKAIYEYVDQSYCITLMRRMMYRIASSIAKKNNCLVLGNGESIGQVASQTLVSIKEIENVATLPIIRPCAVLDKVDIIKIARKIDTYDISIRPYEDCCTIFEPKNVTTKPNKNKIEYYENKFDFAPLIQECIDNVETIVVKFDEEDKNEGFF